VTFFTPSAIRYNIITLLYPHFMSYLVKNQQESLTKILELAPTETGIYSSYLREHLINLQSQPKLKSAFLKIISNTEPTRIDTLLAYQLYRIGLIQWTKKGDHILPSCKLYRLYFSQQFNIN